MEWPKEAFNQIQYMTEKEKSASSKSIFLLLAKRVDR